MGPRDLDLWRRGSKGQPDAWVEFVLLLASRVHDFLLRQQRLGPESAAWLTKANIEKAIADPVWTTDPERGEENLYQDLRRQTARLVPEPAGWLPDPDGSPLDRALVLLSDESRLVVELHYRQHLGVRGVAHATGLSEDEAKQRLDRGLFDFRAAYASITGGPPPEPSVCSAARAGRRSWRLKRRARTLSHATAHVMTEADELFGVLPLPDSTQSAVQDAARARSRRLADAILPSEPPSRGRARSSHAGDAPGAKSSGSGRPLAPEAPAGNWPLSRPLVSLVQAINAVRDVDIVHRIGHAGPAIAGGVALAAGALLVGPHLLPHPPPSPSAIVAPTPTSLPTGSPEQGLRAPEAKPSLTPSPVTTLVAPTVTPVIPIAAPVTPIATPTPSPPPMPSWTQLAPAAPLPSARTDASAVLNAAANKMVLFGGNPVGCSFATSLNDTWLLTNANGLGGNPTWSQLSPSGALPGVRRGHTAVYNPASDRMIVFGGDPVGCAVNKYNDAWVLTNATGSSGGPPAWVQLAPSGGPPPARSDHTAVYDTANDRMIVFGGFGPQGDLSDVWVLTNADGTGGASQWIRLQPTGGPPTGDELHSAVYDPASNRMTVFGGRQVCCGGPTSNQPWVLTNANGLGGNPQWTQLSPTGAPPSPRFGSVSAYVPATNRMIIFGGATSAGQVNEVWVLDNATGLGGTPEWIQILPPTPSPSPRGGEVNVPAWAYDRDADRFIVFGGKTQSGVVNDTWVLSAASGG